MTNGSGKPSHLQEFVMAAKERDLELCSGEEDEYLEIEVHSPTDSSEDSVDVKVFPICLRNKRKCVEPRKVQDAFTAPLKKRMCLQAKSDGAENPEPFRPWSVGTPAAPKTNPPKEKVPFTCVPPEAASFAVPQVPPVLLPPTNYVPAHSSLYVRPPSLRSSSPVQPLPLVKKSPARERKSKAEPSSKVKVEDEGAPCDPSSLRVPLHPHMGISPPEAEELLVSSARAFPGLHPPSVKSEDQASRKEQRNYKNMTRERRIEANARERTRVHTISAAFDTLRRSVPAYSHNQKLSKLSVLRIACSYIMTLSTLVGGPAATEVNPSTSLSDCVDKVSKTIQKEGKLRKKKDELE